MFWRHEAVIATRLSPDEAWSIRKHWGFTMIYKGGPRKVSEESPKNLMTDLFLTCIRFLAPKKIPDTPVTSLHVSVRGATSATAAASRWPMIRTADPSSRAPVPWWTSWTQMETTHISRCVWPWRVETWTSWNNMPNHKVWHLAAGCQKPKKRFAKGWKRAVAVFFFSKGCWKNHEEPCLDTWKWSTNDLMMSCPKMPKLSRQDMRKKQTGPCIKDS